MIKVKSGEKMIYNSWHFTAMFIFIIGSVISPTTVLLSLRVAGTWFLIPDFVTMIVQLIVFTSLSVFLIAAVILFIIGCKKSDSHYRCVH